MKLKEIEQVEIFPPSPYFHFHNRKDSTQKNPNEFILKAGIK